MTPALLDALGDLLGLHRDVDAMTAAQMAARAVLVYVFTLAIVRLGSRRFLSRATAFDVIVAIMLGSIVSRGINGSAPLGLSLVAGVSILALHWLLAFLAFRVGWFGSLVKGNPVLVIKDGEFQTDAMRRAGFSVHDLEEQLRVQARTTEPSGVAAAYLERSGSVSIIPMPREPRVLEVSVADGVQTVRITLE